MNKVYHQKKDLLKEYYQNKHEIILLQKRNHELKKQIKAMEIAEGKTLHEKLQHKDTIIRGLQDELRRKDREIRHLQRSKLELSD